ncbi:hypothetical protein chiPu_0020859 [Chiloscyllium punctatum]|uniref:Uncharacterized protein n=1 Tax=Chiloscyllium punctatum TaxID=137246 RepID=A0A401RKK7_CHIPU|nr:hypothetical protein [Chiloscyllium punctatum]
MLTASSPFTPYRPLTPPLTSSPPPLTPPHNPTSIGVLLYARPDAILCGSVTQEGYEGEGGRFTGRNGRLFQARYSMSLNQNKNQ